MSATVISLINQKGGCGKSSVCFHVGGHLAASGLRVLLIDADPQGSLSQGFFGSAVIESLPADRTLAAMFENAGLASEKLPMPTRFSQLEVIRANHWLARHNQSMPETTGLRQFALASFLEPFSGFDVILIDCPPNLYLCSWNALLASDFVLIPVPPEDFSAQGLRAVHAAVNSAIALNHRLSLLGHLITRADSRLVIHRGYEQKLRERFGEQVLDTVIPEAAAFKVAITCRTPITSFAPRSKAAQAICNLGNEIMRRIQTYRDRIQKVG